MRTKLNINTIDGVKRFVKQCSKFDCDIFLTDGRCNVDAKSIMGVFSLDLRKPVEVYTECAEQGNEILKAVHEFRVES